MVKIVSPSYSIDDEIVADVNVNITKKIIVEKTAELYHILTFLKGYYI